MGLKLKLTEKVSEGLYKAEGTFSALDKNKQPLSGYAIVLVKDSDQGLVLHLDSKILVSKIHDREVVAYINSEPVAVKKVKEGATVEFTNSYFQPKKTLNLK